MSLVHRWGVRAHGRMTGKFLSVGPFYTAWHENLGRVFSLDKRKAWLRCWGDS